MLNVSYLNKEIGDVCRKIDKAQARFGPQDASELHELLSEAESFEFAGELLDFRDGEILPGDSLSFSFGSHYRAAFEAVGDEPPREDDGCIAWGRVRRIMLIEIQP